MVPRLTRQERRVPTRDGSDSFRISTTIQCAANGGRSQTEGQVAAPSATRHACSVSPSTCIPVTGRISHLRIKETIKFTDPDGLLYPFSGTSSLDGLNPFALTGNAGLVGNSFDPEGLVVDPRTGHFLVADEYGPSLYEFDRQGRLVHVFQTPHNLVPRAGVLVNFVATRDACTATLLPPFCGLTAGRQDNRGYEGLAITPDGKKLYAVLQDPLVNEPPPNNGRNGRNLRIVVFDNDRESATFGTSIAQYAYQLELQADVAARIIAAGGAATGTDPRQGRNIGLSAIVAVNEHEFLVLERDNRGIGVDDPAGANVVGSKRIYKIQIDPLTTDISNVSLPSRRQSRASRDYPGRKVGGVDRSQPPYVCCQTRSRRKNGRGWRLDRDSRMAGACSSSETTMTTP